MIYDAYVHTLQQIHSTYKQVNHIVFTQGGGVITVLSPAHFHQDFGALLRSTVIISL